VLALQAAGEVHEHWHTTREAVREPRVKSRGRPWTHHPAKALGQCLGHLKSLILTSRPEELWVGWHQGLLGT
jgi:hypothetical protein